MRKSSSMITAIRQQRKLRYKGKLQHFEQNYQWLYLPYLTHLHSLDACT